MKKEIVINPLIGLNSLKFGSAKKSAEEYFGKPQETEILDADEEDVSNAIVWNYDDLEFSAFFENDLDELLTCFDLTNENATLFGKKVFEFDKEKIIELMQNNGYADYEAEDEDWGEHRLSFNDAVMDFYFEDNKLVSVSWGVMINDDNKVQWP